jgi:NEDD8-activating enzyme E1 regulatory subunit
VISASATSTSILKNLVLPGIGHFTIIDHAIVSPEDAGNNFFLDGPNSIGKSRAHEAVRLLSELNDGVEGNGDTSRLEEVNPAYLTSFTLIIAHNFEASLLEPFSDLLWSNPSYPPLVVVRSAGFLAEFFIQFHEHPSQFISVPSNGFISTFDTFLVVESHIETSPSLRIDQPFPALLEHALSLNFANMDPTEHTHIPYVVILVRALEDWKQSVSTTIHHFVFDTSLHVHWFIDILAQRSSSTNFR